MTTLIIARHGNTFNVSETPTRVGARTDLPLVESGKEQARKMGAWLKAQNLYPEIVYSSELKRTQETAQIAIETLGYKQPVFPATYRKQRHIPANAGISFLNEKDPRSYLGCGRRKRRD